MKTKDDEQITVERLIGFLENYPHDAIVDFRVSGEWKYYPHELYGATAPVISLMTLGEPESGEEE